MRRIIDLSILALVFVVGFFAVRNAQTIGDWWHNNRYDPPTEVTQLADDSGMNSNGRNLFYRFEPRLVDQQQLDKVCSIEKLGCTEGQSIYILQPTTDSDKNRNIVTASHEMLHVAYSRLSQKERDDLETLLSAELDKPQGKYIVKKLEGYPKEDYYNEAHSFIGSELASVSSELETYYSKYFGDRSKSTSAFTQSPDGN